MSRRRHNVKIQVRALEMTRGHDGPLRGHPEPVLLIGHFRVASGRAAPCGRIIVGFKPQGSYPLVVEPTKVAVLRNGLRSLPDHALLLIALERDGGLDVQRLYAALDESPPLALWDADTDIPAPVALVDAIAWTGRPRRVRIFEGHRDLGECCRSDELIGCALVPLEHRLRREDLRLAVRSDDGRNDWTAVLRVEVT